MITMRKCQAMHAEIESLKTELSELKASLPKVRADAVLGAAKKLDVYCINYVDGVDIGDLLE